MVKNIKLTKTLLKPVRRMPMRLVKYFVFFTVIVFIYICCKTVMINEIYRSVHHKMSRPHEQKLKLFYILLWTLSDTVPFVYMGVGRQGFIDRNCPYTNCFVTSNQTLLGNYTKFDVIAFAGPQLLYTENLPAYRSPHQKFAFVSIESPIYYPICQGFNDFFNWTWTYRLDSDSRWGYIVVRDVKGVVVGPNIGMQWIQWENMLPPPDNVKIVLQQKTKLAAWFVSNCHSSSFREAYFRDLQTALYRNYNKTVDVYGACSIKECARANKTVCDEMIRKDYKFYLVFENALSEDYVTEKLLHAVKYNAIPVVYGGADYSRFLPPHSYLNAKNISASDLATKMVELSDNISDYMDYFRWTRYYSYHRKDESADTDDYCGLCSLLNNKTKVRETSIYKKFSEWWNHPNMCWLW